MDFSLSAEQRELTEAAAGAGSEAALRLARSGRLHTEVISAKVM